jgi:hypothetical protein
MEGTRIMPSGPDSKKVKLESISHAIDVGYEIGKALRDKGIVPVEEGTHMELWGGEHKASPYLSWWNKGFEAGFRGEAKPTAP